MCSSGGPGEHDGSREHSTSDDGSRQHHSDGDDQLDYSSRPAARRTSSVFCERARTEIENDCVDDESWLWELEATAHRIACIESAVRFCFNAERTVHFVDEVITALIPLDVAKYMSLSEYDSSCIQSIVGAVPRYSASLNVECITSHFASQIIGVLHNSAEACANAKSRHTLILCRGWESLAVHFAPPKNHDQSPTHSNAQHFSKSQTLHNGEKASSFEIAMRGRAHLFVFDPRQRPGQSQRKPSLLEFITVSKCDEYIGSFLGGTHLMTLAPIHAFKMTRNEQITTFADVPSLGPANHSTARSPPRFTATATTPPQGRKKKNARVRTSPESSKHNETCDASQSGMSCCRHPTTPELQHTDKKTGPVTVSVGVSPIESAEFPTLPTLPENEALVNFNKEASEPPKLSENAPPVDDQNDQQTQSCETKLCQVAAFESPYYRSDSSSLSEDPKQSSVEVEVDDLEVAEFVLRPSDTTEIIEHLKERVRRLELYNASLLEENGKLTAKVKSQMKKSTY